MERTINEQQAELLALAFKAFISDYIKEHKAEYLTYLEKTGQKDNYYQKTEAEQ